MDQENFTTTEKIILSLFENMRKAGDRGDLETVMVVFNVLDLVIRPGTRVEGSEAQPVIQKEKEIL